MVNSYRPAITVDAIGETNGRLSLTASARGKTISLARTKPNDQTKTGYQVRNRHSDRSGWSKWKDIEGAGRNATRHTLAKLTNGREYRVQISAKNLAEESEASETVRATPESPYPVAPTGISATVGNASIAISLDDPSDRAITGYLIRVKKVSDSKWKAIPNSEAATTSYKLSGLTNGTECSIQIRVKNANGNSSSSDTAKATPIGG